VSVCVKARQHWGPFAALRLPLGSADGDVIGLSADGDVIGLP
jgi:hypothetical protein